MSFENAHLLEKWRAGDVAQFGLRRSGQRQCHLVAERFDQWKCAGRSGATSPDLGSLGRLPTCNAVGFRRADSGQALRVKIEGEMAKRNPTWTDVKKKLAGSDRAELLVLHQELYAAHQDNRTFLHTRFGLSEDVLEPYKKTIDRWLWPDVYRNQQESVSKAGQAIADYRKAAGDPAGLAEWVVFYCERMVGFARQVGYDDA